MQPSLAEKKNSIASALLEHSVKAINFHRGPIKSTDKRMGYKQQMNVSL
jgi:hypothetical protein